MDKHELRQYIPVQGKWLGETGSAKGRNQQHRPLATLHLHLTVLVKKEETVIPDSTAPYHTFITGKKYKRRHMEQPPRHRRRGKKK